MDKYVRKDEESDEELIFRVCSDKDIIGSWQNVADILNELLNTEYSESKFRKQFQAFNKMMEANQHIILDDDNYLKEIRLEKQELQKEKQKLSDERVEFNRQIREQARRESFEDMIKRVICENVEPLALRTFNENGLVVNQSGRDLLLHITDIHTGIEINEFNNIFNEDVLRERLESYTEKIIEIAKIQNAENCYIVVSEILSGIIHNNLRLQNNMDLMEQFKYVSNLLSEMFITLEPCFNSINIYTVEGNHSRLIQNKEDSLQGENFDILLPFYLKARLQNYEHINIYDNKVCQDIAMFHVRDNLVMASHGDKDNPSSVVQNFTMMFGEKPDIVMLGHRHVNSMETVYDTKVIQSGCISGSDPYALSIRKTNKPEQMVVVVDDNGVVCLYDIRLN